MGEEMLNVMDFGGSSWTVVRDQGSLYCNAFDGWLFDSEEEAVLELAKHALERNAGISPSVFSEEKVPLVESAVMSLSKRKRLEFRKRYLSGMPDVVLRLEARGAWL